MEHSIEDWNALVIENRALKSFKSFALQQIKSMSGQELLDAKKKFKKNRAVMELFSTAVGDSDAPPPGVLINTECQSAFQQMSESNSGLRYIIYKIDDQKQLVVESTKLSEEVSFSPFVCFPSH